jgi:hypothetical protein
MSNKRFAALAIAGWFAFLALGAFIGYGVDANIPNVRTANYQIAPSDCTKTVLAGTGSSGQFTLTLPAVTGFPSNCSVVIKNGDNASGKILAGFPTDLGPLLYPRQSLGMKIVSGQWRSFYAPAPWVPLSTTTLFVSTTGDDTNDGLTSGTPITLATACSRRQAFFSVNAAVLTIQLADGTYSTVVNGSLCSIGGNTGGGSQTLTNIKGNCGAPSNVIFSIPDGQTGLFVKDLGETEIQCVQFQGAGSGVSVGISAAQFSVVDLQSTVWGSFGNGSLLINVSQSSSLNLVGAAAMTLNAAPGGTGTVIVLSSSANMLGANASIAIPSALAWGGQFIQLYGPVMANLSGMTFTGSGVAGTTGKRAALIGNAFLTTGSIACNTFFPGNGACTLIQGAEDDAGDAPTTPLPAPTTTFAGLPTPVAGMYAYITDGKASNCADTTCTTFGTAVTGGTGALPLFIWYTGAAWHLVGK